MKTAIEKLVDMGSHGYIHLAEEGQRAVAVAAALELIGAKASASPAYAAVLKNEISQVGAYADAIQAALKVK
ncbi:hypothetical protein K0038_02577 [Pseudomonas syringae]|uniref:hypothetical protein n=1 Tax=Pseudomonas syringae group TaxID=136849 RepID=UPI001FD8AB38|nr:hypothetical protein [Pseudomonas syringae]MCI3945535.1 hypothetical protein [Pseudomonas syringae]MEE4133071.1 hypothetical protein [Pseudomonas viridiflava]